MIDDVSKKVSVSTIVQSRKDDPKSSQISNLSVYCISWLFWACRFCQNSANKPKKGTVTNKMGEFVTCLANLRGGKHLTPYMG